MSVVNLCRARLEASIAAAIDLLDEIDAEAAEREPDADAEPDTDDEIMSEDDAVVDGLKSVGRQWS